jgi:type I restriction enzyme S subunit
VLSALDDQIITNKKINHHLEQIAQAIFKSWFVDFEPFGGVMPDDWREGTLGDICSFQAGFAFPKDEQGAVASDIPFIKVSDMNSVENGYFIIRSNNWISNETAKRLKLKLAPIGAIVFAKIGEALKAERLRVIVRLTAIDNNMMTAIASSPVYAAYLPFLLEDIHLAEWAEGSALPYLRQSDLTKIPIVIPAQKALKFFSAVMKPIEGMKLMKSKEGSHLASLRDSLLPRLMSGELSVSDLPAK